jgi:hypothetical protein
MSSWPPTIGIGSRRELGGWGGEKDTMERRKKKSKKKWKDTHFGVCSIKFSRGKMLENMEGEGDCNGFLLLVDGGKNGEEIGRVIGEEKLGCGGRE